MKPITKERLKFLASLLFNPVKNLDYFRHYFNLVEQIANNGQLQNCFAVKVYVLFQVVMACKAVHFFYLAFFSGLTDLDNLLHFDAFFVMMQKAQINVMTCCGTVEALCLNRALVVKVNRRLLQLLYDVLLCRDCSFFIERKFRGKDICDQVQKCFQQSMSVFMSITSNGIIFYMISCVYFWREFYWRRNYFLEQSLGYFILAIWLNFVNGLGFLMYYFNFAFMYSYNFSPMITLVYMFYIRIVQCNKRLIKVITAERFSPYLYAHYRRAYLQTLGFFFQLNRMYGKLFFVFLITNCPRNVTFTVWLMPKGNSFLTKCILYFWIVYLGIFLFMIHLMLAFCTKHIHRPCKSMFSLIARAKQLKWISRGTRMRLTLNLFALHNTNRYGFTYGNFGLVSLNTFSKFLLLYGKFIIIFYKLMKKKVL